jgi:hypothetical protein
LYVVVPSPKERATISAIAQDSIGCAEKIFATSIPTATGWHPIFINCMKEQIEHSRRIIVRTRLDTRNLDHHTGKHGVTEDNTTEAHRPAKPIDKRMYHNAPANELVVPINMPQQIWALNMILAPSNHFAITQFPPKHVNVLKSANNSPSLYSQSTVLQMSNKITVAGFWSLHFESFDEIT